MPLDLEKCGTLKVFSKQLEKYAKRYKEQVPQKKRQKVSEFSFLPSSGYVPQEIIFSALRKCLTVEGFFSAKGLGVLLENMYITPGVDDDLIFEVILKYKAYSLLNIIAKTFNVVAEKHIVRTLKGILHGVSIDESKSLCTNLYTVDCPVPSIVISNLIGVLKLPLNKVGLKDYLKLLTLNEALAFLQCLIYILHRVSPALVQGPLKDKLVDEGITESIVVIWLDLLLTAHLMAFATSNTLPSLINDIRLCIQKQKFYYSQISQLWSLLLCLKGGKSLEKPIAKYTIENINL